MTETQHGILQHALGLNRRKHADRNHYATKLGCTSYPDVYALCVTGYMAEGVKIPGGLTSYHATDAGVAAAKLTFEELAALLVVAQKMSFHEIVTVGAVDPVTACSTSRTKTP